MISFRFGQCVNTLTIRFYISIFIFTFLIANDVVAQLSSSVEYGASVHAGDYIPLWQVSNNQGIGSIYNNTYVRGTVGYKHRLGNWSFEEKVDLVASIGTSFKSEKGIFIQQAYVDVRYKWFGLFAGSREKGSTLLNDELSSGEMTWSGNSRPIPQVMIAIPEYLYVLPRLAFKAEISYGWFTDTRYQEDKVGANYWYTRNIKYHHKEGFVRVGIPNGKWQLDIGMIMDTQFGGYQMIDGEKINLGNGIKDYFRAFVPGAADSEKPWNDSDYIQGNFVGSEQVRLTHNNEKFSISAYVSNYFEDLSGMGKQNGWDGLWGVELNFKHFKPINSIVLEYLQTTDQSGPLHGLHEEGEGPVQKTGGADNYYNNSLYPSWSHWGMANGNPLLRSPIYNENGNMAFIYSRVRAMHLGWSGDITDEWRYVGKFSFNRTWGTMSVPTLDILENFSAYASFYYTPRRWDGWKFNASVAFDMGDIYGDNFGFQLKIHKSF